MTRRHEILIELLRSAIHGCQPTEAIFEGMTEKEWSEVYAEAVRHGVLALAFDSVSRMPKELQPPLKVKMQWACNVDYAARKYEARRRALHRLAEQFSREDIRILLLKGFALSRYYPTPSQRQFGDIDIWLFGRADDGNKVVSEQGIKVDRENYKHDIFTFDKFDIENHRHFVGVRESECNRRIEGELLHLAETSQPVEEEGNIYMPSADFNILFLSRHSSGHFVRYSVKLRDVCDWALFLKHEIGSLHIEESARRLETCGMDVWASIITDICREHLGLEISLPLKPQSPELVQRVFDDILTFDNPLKHPEYGFAKRLVMRIKAFCERRWCYGTVTPDTYTGKAGYIFKRTFVAPLLRLNKKHQEQ